MKILSKIVLISVFIASPAQADNTGKMYILGDMGSATYSNLSPRNNSSVFRIALGSRFNPNFAAEVGYSKFSELTKSGPGGPATVSPSAYQIAAIGKLPINPYFDLIGKLGLSFNSSNETHTFEAESSVSKNSLLFGVGAQIHMESRISIRAQYEDYGDFDNSNNPMKATAVSIGIIYNL